MPFDPPDDPELRRAEREGERDSEASSAEEEEEEEEDRKPPSARTPQLNALLSRAAPGILQKYYDIQQLPHPLPDFMTPGPKLS